MRAAGSTRPCASAPYARKSLKTDPGEYMFWTARFWSGRSGFSISPFHSAGVTRRVNQFGS